MRRERLRPAHREDELCRLYDTRYDHTRWVDHQIRVAATLAVVPAIEGHSLSGADLSCGDGAVLRAMNLTTRHFGDLTPGYDHTGPIEQTVQQIPDVDVFVCTETIEHLDDPGAVLVAIGQKSARLVLSTPVDAWGDPNPEHYWAWDREAVEDMLTTAGFRVAVYAALDLRPQNSASYCFGIWGCLR